MLGLGLGLWVRVRVLALKQMHAVGFEALVLSFGSGFRFVMIYR